MKRLSGRGKSLIKRRGGDNLGNHRVLRLLVNINHFQVVSSGQMLFAKAADTGHGLRRAWR